MKSLLATLLLVASWTCAFAANLIPNSSFETGFNRGWRQVGPSSGSAFLGDVGDPKVCLISDAHTGRYGVSVSGGAYYSRLIYMTAVNHTLSFYGKTGSGTQGPLYFGVVPAALAGSATDTSGGVPLTVAGTTNITASWARYTLSYTPGSNNFYYVVFFTLQPSIHIDDVMLETGATASAYEPESVIEVGLTCANTNNMWFIGDARTFTLNYWNNGVANTGYTHYVVYDAFNSNCLSGVTNLSLPASTNSSQVINLPTKDGWYRPVIRLTTTNVWDEMTLTCYPFVSNVTTHATNDWLGGHPNGSRWHGFKDLLANYKWARLLSPDYRNFRWFSSQGDGLEQARGDVYTWDDSTVTNLSFQGINIIACLTPEDGWWPTWATNADGTGDLMALSNYCYQVVNHNKAWVHYWEMGPNEPFQTGPYYDHAIIGAENWSVLTGTNKPVNSRVATNYAKMLAAGVSGITNADSTAKIIGMAGAFGAGEWADEVWTNLSANIQSWIPIVSTHQYPQDNSQDPNMPRFYQGTFSNPEGWIQRFKSRGVEVWNTENGTWAAGAFKTLNGSEYLSFNLDRNLGTYPESSRFEFQQRSMTAVVRELCVTLSCIGYGFDRVIYYDSRLWGLAAFSASTPYPTDYTLVDHPYRFALSAAASAIRHGTGSITNQAMGWFYVEAYACTNANGQAVIPIWSGSRTNTTFTLDNANFEVLDYSLNMEQTNNATFIVGRVPKYLRSGSRTIAQLSNSVRSATAAIVADTLAPNTSIDIAPSGLWNGSATSQLFKWTAVDDSYTGYPTNTVFVTDNAKTNILYSWRLNGASYTTPSQSNYTWLGSIPNGTNTFWVKTWDAQGNVAEVSHEFSPNYLASDGGPTNSGPILNVSGVANVGKITTPQ